MITHLEYQSALGKSDHNVLYFKYNCYTFTRNKRRVKKLYDKADYNAIEEIIMNIKWEELLGGHIQKEDRRLRGEVCTKERTKIRLQEKQLIPNEQTSPSKD